MARIVKRGRGFQIRVSNGYTAKGKQNIKTMTWSPEPSMSERQIEKELERQAVLFEEACHGLSGKANMKFEEFTEQWFKEYAEPNLRIRTVDRYKTFKGRTFAAIGTLRMDKITPRHIQAFVNNLQEKGIKKGGGCLSPKTVREYQSFISTIFDYAVKMDMLKDNPCRRVILPPLHRKEHDCYTLEEAQHFLQLLDFEPILFKAFFTLAIYGGFRKGEILGLEWSDIDFGNCIVSIQRTSLYSKTKGGTFTDTTKTEKSRRSLKLPQGVFDVLQQLRAEQSKERLKLGSKWINSNRLFTTWNGAPMGTSTPLKWLNDFTARTGQRKTTIHSFRHLNASLLINAGVDVRTVSASLGHSETSTTLNIYTHSFQEAQAKASQAIADSLQLKQVETKAQSKA